MEIAELPFWVLLIFTILPITIGMLLFIRILDMFREIVRKYKEKATIMFEQAGDLLLLLVFLAVMINLVLYMIGDQPSGFSIFTYLVEEMLPITWYTILVYGILVQLQIMLSRGGNVSD